MPEHRRFLRGMVAWVGFDQVPIEYRRAGRHAGRGASYRALFRLAFEALASFSDVPLALATIAGTAVAALAGATARRDPRRDDLRLGQREPRRLDARRAALPRRRAAVSVGILGRYLARVHEQTLGRPLYVVDRVAGSSGASADAPAGGTTAPPSPATPAP